MKLQARFSASILLAFAVSALADPIPRIAVTRHEGTFNGQAMSYTATVAETFLHDTRGTPTASVITIAYVRNDVSDLSRRPVLFCFNGGPGASSSQTHTEALGPMIHSDSRLGAAAAEVFHENPTSPLDAVDLVFIDPVSTGFSRLLPGADPKRYYSVTGDALEVKEIIQHWLKVNHREASPRYILGESYGTTRAAAIVKNGRDLHLDGVLLVALNAITSGNEIPYVTALPTMAAGAWFHRKIDRKGRSVSQVFDGARAFARTSYVTALIEGVSRSPSETHQIAQKMSSWIGLPTDFIEAHGLRISTNDYMFNLLKSQGLRTGRLDVTVTAPLEPGQEGALDDPALGVVPKRIPGAAIGPPLTPDKIGPVPTPSVGHYLTGVLKFPSKDVYIGVNFSANAQWNYETRGNDPSLRSSDFQGLADAMKADSHLRLFWAAGYYDLATPAYAGRYVLDQAGVPAAQLNAQLFAGPHGVYSGNPANRERFDNAVRTFIVRGSH